ncbi:unnamed protein product, partial [Rotaria magnacalcarata]
GSSVTFKNKYSVNSLSGNETNTGSSSSAGWSKHSKRMFCGFDVSCCDFDVDEDFVEEQGVILIIDDPVDVAD